MKHALAALALLTVVASAGRAFADTACCKNWLDGQHFSDCKYEQSACIAAQTAIDVQISDSPCQVSVGEAPCEIYAIDTCCLQDCRGEAQCLWQQGVPTDAYPSCCIGDCTEQHCPMAYQPNPDGGPGIEVDLPGSCIQPSPSCAAMHVYQACCGPTSVTRPSIASDEAAEWLVAFGDIVAPPVVAAPDAGYLLVPEGGPGPQDIIGPAPASHAGCSAGGGDAGGWLPLALAAPVGWLARRSRRQ
jgi:uncharacterized protein (TIGR03382 family)